MSYWDADRSMQSWRGFLLSIIFFMAAGLVLRSLHKPWIEVTAMLVVGRSLIFAWVQMRRRWRPSAEA